MLAAFMRTHYRSGAQALDEREPHIGHRGLAIESAFTFERVYELIQRGIFRSRQRERALDKRVALDHFRRGESKRQPRLARRRLKHVHERVNATVHLAKWIALSRVGRAKIDAFGHLSIQRDMHRMIDELVDAFILYRGNGHHGNAERGLELVDAHRTAIGAKLVHHVQRKHHGNIELHELQRKIEVSLDIGRVNDVDNGCGRIVDKKIARNDFLIRIRRQRIDARKVDHGRLGMAPQLAFLFVNRHTREIAHMLVRARELVEERSFAAVLVARQGERYRLSLRDGLTHVANALVARSARLANARMPGVNHRRNGRGTIRRRGELVDGRYRHLLGIGNAQSKLIAAQLNLQRVAHGRHFAQPHADTRR